MENIVTLKTYSLPEFDRKEILRYSGVRGEAKDLLDILEDCIEEARKKISPKACYMELPISFCEGYVDFGFFKTESEDLKKNLKNCSSIVIFAGTIGIEIDRLISRYATVSPVKSLFFQAIGAERIEKLCDMVNDEITKEKNMIGQSTSARFSAGYGDFDIVYQKEIFKILDPARKIGLSLNESLLMSPSKSVTAIIGVLDEANKNDNKKGCKGCDKTDCDFRRKYENH